MRSLTVWKSTLLGLTLVACVSPAMAASFSFAGLLPGVQLSAMFDLDRSSAAGGSGSRAPDAPHAEDAVDATPDAAVKDPEAAAPSNARAKPGAASQQRAPRWKSLIPGALK